MESRAGKKWQNLIRRCCPYCDGKLEPPRSNTSIHQCRTPGCEFMISEHITIFMILSDETHTKRKHLTTEGRLHLDRVFGTAITEETEESINQFIFLGWSPLRWQGPLYT